MSNESKAEYILNGWKKQEAFATKYYICHRSGLYIEKIEPGSERKRKIKSQGTCKLNFNCTSTIKCKILSNDEH